MKKAEYKIEVRYSETDEPDRQGRWARQITVNDFAIGRITMIFDPKDNSKKFSSYTFFPTNKNDSPHESNVSDNFDDALDFIRTKWLMFARGISNIFEIVPEQI